MPWVVAMSMFCQHDVMAFFGVNMICIIFTFRLPHELTPSAFVMSPAHAGSDELLLDH